jgi:hypothetical protein
MANNEPRGSDTANDAVFAMDPEPTLRELVRYLVARQQQMADLSRAMNRGVHDRDDAEVQNLITEWKDVERRWAASLPWLTAAMKLALEVYDTFGPGMTCIADPVESAIWNNKYLVWERELTTTGGNFST